MESRFKKNILKIKEELFKYESVSRADLFSSCIQDKLDTTLRKYNYEISRNADYLRTRSSAKVLKALTKLQKKDDMELLDSMAEDDEGEYRYE